MIGQINKSDAEPILPKENIPTEDRDELMAAYNSLPIISTDKLRSAFHILDACASYELLKSLVQFYNTPIDTQLDKYIYDNIATPLSVSELRSKFHLSHHEVYNICKEYFNCTPAEHIKKCRLAHACKLLTTTSLSVQEIAIRCGIPDYNYFSKIFKSSFGLSPTKYKKANQP